MSKTKLRSRLVRAGLASAAATVTVVAAAAVPAFAAAVPLTLSSAVGPTATANTTVTATAATAFLNGINTPGAAIAITACPGTFSTTDVPVSAATTGYLQAVATKISDTKVAVKLPAVPAMPAGSATTKYNICVYADTTTGALVGNAAYSVSPAVSLTNVTISPASGPAIGGTKITVSGSGAAFPTTANSITATLGGTPLTNITPVTATSFTATTPYHTASSAPVALTVTTSAGTQSKAGAFTFSNGINVTPDTAPNTATAVYMDIYGAGFSALSFSSSALPQASPTGARVLLVKGAYNDDVTGSHYNGGVAECTPVTTIADNEIICKMNLNAGGLDPTDPTNATPTNTTVPNGTYTVTVVSDSTPNATATATTNHTTLPTATDVSSGATFTVAPY